jgi:prevent-host-death family protein
MEVTTKELRIHPGKILDQVLNGDDITVTYRGKRIARIVPIEEEKTGEPIDSIFGMWADHEEDVSVAASVRRLRQGRKF